MVLKYCGGSELPIASCAAHSHKEWEIVFQKSGDATTDIEGVPFHLVAGDVLLLPPGTVHSVFSDSYYSDIYVRPDMLPMQEKPFVVHDYDGTLRTLFKMILKVYVEKERNHHAICNGLLEAICAVIERNYEVSYRYAFVVDLKKIIYENISDPTFSVTDVILKMGYNPDHVRRRFTEEVGVSPHRYLSNLRLSLARKRLMNEQYMNIEAIARECGFDDAFYFSRLFKKTFGLSPREFRAQP